MGNEALNLKTDDSLLSALRNAATKKQTANEIQEQRISFVFGSLDSDSDVTKEQIRQIISAEKGFSF